MLTALTSLDPNSFLGGLVRLPLRLIPRGHVTVVWLIKSAIRSRLSASKKAFAKSILNSCSTHMRWVVFLRGVNVGKHNRFQPGLLTKKLSRFGLINIGAVGTFVIRENVSESALRKALAAELPFTCEIMIRPASEIVNLVQSAPFQGESFNNDYRAFVTVMAKSPPRSLKLPIYAPDAKSWEVKIVRVTGMCVLSLWRRRRKNSLYPNQVIEKEFRVATTTRSWTTILKVSDLLKPPKERA